MSAAAPMRLVFLGLSLSSSWGNGHATTFRALLRALAARGHRIDFLERDVPWYAENRDLPTPDFCRLHLYRSLDELDRDHGELLEGADAVVVGSYVPDGVAVVDLALARAAGAVGFYDIDTPVTLAALAAGRAEYVAARQLGQLDFYLSFAGGPCLAELAGSYGVRLASAFYCMVDADRYRPVDTATTWDLGYMGTYSPDRQQALEELLIEPARRLPHRRFVVAGPQYPEAIDWPPNVERRSHVAPDDHPRFYSSLRFALNLTRADMKATGWAPSVRLFEAAACGTALVSDRWPGLEEVFPDGDALRSVATTSDVVEILERLTENERVRMARRAHEIVLSAHTGQCRAETFERVVRRAGGRRECRSFVSREKQHAGEF